MHPTLQEDVSAGQFQEMKESGVRLVVPAGLVKSYPEEIRPDLVMLESFIGESSRMRAGRSAASAPVVNTAASRVAATRGSARSKAMAERPQRFRSSSTRSAAPSECRTGSCT